MDKTITVLNFVAIAGITHTGSVGNKMDTATVGQRLPNQQQ